MGPRSLNLTGQQFGRLTALQMVGRKGTSTFWECRCRCGKTAVVRSAFLRSGNTKSCGCLRSSVAERNRKRSILYGREAEIKRLKRKRFTNVALARMFKTTEHSIARALKRA